MKIELLETFITGHPVIDRQHRSIVDAINGVSDAINSGAYDRCAILLDDFLGICENHFTTEEKILEDLGYPGVKEHAVFHQELILKARAVKSLCMDTHKPDSIKRCFDEMATLLIEDVVKGDLQFVSFLIDQNVVEPRIHTHTPAKPDSSSNHHRTLNG